MKTWVFYLFIFFISFDAFASPKCDYSDVYQIQVSLNPKDPKSKKIPYYYRLKNGTDSQNPTVIFIPGGPGEHSIGFDPTVPAQYSLIQIDPRGTGCNQEVFDQEDRSFYNGENLAHDILELIIKLKLKNYIVYGSSYGTVLATILTNTLAKKYTHQPISLVLESTLGRATESLKEAYGHFSEIWNEKFKPLTMEQKKPFLSDSPFGLTQEELGEFLFQALYGEESYLDQLIKMGTKSENHDYIKRAITRDLTALAKQEESENEYLFKKISCEELHRFPVAQPKLIAGKLEFEAASYYCEEFFLSNPFDSKNYPISVPIYYFVGKKDPITPPWQTNLHFIKQPELTKKTQTIISNEPHAALQALTECQTEVWEAMYKHLPLKNALKECPQEVKILQ